MARKCYAFDVDETLEVSSGPITLASVLNLRNEGHITGICGNYAVVTRTVWNWPNYFSFLGSMSMTKEEFLLQLAAYLSVEEVVMVGNIHGVSGHSYDSEAAEKAAELAKGNANFAPIRFIKESDFADGKR